MLSINVENRNKQLGSFSPQKLERLVTKVEFYNMLPL